MRIPRYDLLTEKDFHILLARLGNDKIQYSNYWDSEGRANRARVVTLENILIENYFCDAYPNTNRREEKPQRGVSETQTPTIQPGTQRDIQDDDGDGRTLLLLPRAA